MDTKKVSEISMPTYLRRELKFSDDYHCNSGMVETRVRSESELALNFFRVFF